jgi:hypothetical protein
MSIKHQFKWSDRREDRLRYILYGKSFTLVYIVIDRVVEYR